MGEMTMVERVARAIESTACPFGYEIRLTRLVDGVSTYTLTYDDRVGPLEFGSNGEANRHVSERKREVQARAAIEAMREPTKRMIEAADEVAGTINPIDAYVLAIDAALAGMG
jgi:hypothetical protein